MRIFKGFHYGCPLLAPFPIKYNATKISRDIQVRFDESIRYDIGDDQSDVNKLIGYSFGFHHINSDRIGFRYNKETDRVEIVCYSYESGKRLRTKKLYDAEIGELLHIMISSEIFANENGDRKRKTVFYCNGKNVIKEYAIDGKCCKWSYGLGLYFGGNCVAPHTITIKRQ